MTLTLGIITLFYRKSSIFLLIFKADCIFFCIFTDVDRQVFYQYKQTFKLKNIKILAVLAFIYDICKQISTYKEKMMKTRLVLLSIFAFVLSGCTKHDFVETNETPQSVKNWEYAEKLFGVNFDSGHDWCTTTSNKVTVTGIPAGTTKVALYALVGVEVKDELVPDGQESREVTSLLKLNEDAVVNGSQVSLVYDAPSANKGIYAAIDCNGHRQMKLVSNGVADFTKNHDAAARRTPDYSSFSSMTLTEEVESYASKRNWLPGQKLYGMSDEAYEGWKTSASNYSDEYCQTFRTIIFSYFKNGRSYNNLPLIMESNLYNESIYPVTTGDAPITVSPVYKSDQATRYGNEVWNSDLYYYYFKESDLDKYVANGGSTVDFLNNLPKFKAIPFKQHFGETEDDKIEKRASYTLIYWGDGTPELGTTGQPFPAGYKIGFMIRAKTTAEGGKKQGELYGDGRLNNDINNYDKCNFKSSVTCSNGAMAIDGPRASWINVEDRLFMCFESGTDADFNDIILEVEGGIEPISFIPEFENDSYTFCFEDRDQGDYDMNDIVIKATRINKNVVEYSIVACGAYDQLQVKNINGSVINGDKEVHELFGVPTKTFINTQEGATVYEPITERVNVDDSFSFLNADTQPYIYNVSEDKEIKLSKNGEDPHGIMIPYDFRYPLERVCIKNAYGRFNEWGQNRVNSTDWYKYFTQGTVY